MLDFNFYSPTEFSFGKGKEEDCGKLVKKYGGTKVLIHYGSGSVKRSGLLDRVKKSLDDEKVSYVELGGVMPNPRDTMVYEGIKLCKKENVDFILSVGGGSCIDSSKAIAVGVYYDGDFWDFFGTGKEIKKALPIGTVLTISAAGSEGSNSCVITKEDGLLKRAISTDLIRPKFSILNPQLTCTLPPYQTACGVTDIMAHLFERYFTNTVEVEITDRLCEAILLTMIKEAPRVIADPNNYEARANIMWAGTLAHNNVVGVGRIQDWNSHGIEHELSAYYDCAHGAGLAVVMPAWMEYGCRVRRHDLMRFAQMAVRVFGCEMDFADPYQTAMEGIKRFRKFLLSIGMPINFEQLGADKKDIKLLAEKMHINGKREGFIDITTEDVVKILEIAADATL